MALTQDLTGTLVAAWKRPYDFNDRETGRAVSGVARSVCIVTAPDEEPQFVKVRDEALFDDLAEATGVGVRVRCEARASGSRIVLQAVELLEADPLLGVA